MLERTKPCWTILCGKPNIVYAICVAMFSLTYIGRLDHQVLRDEILNIMIAGRDTMAATMTFAVYFLFMYPHVLARLRQEVMEHVGPMKRSSYEDIRKIKYLRAVINGAIEFL